MSSSYENDSTFKEEFEDTINNSIPRIVDETRSIINSTGLNSISNSNTVIIPTNAPSLVVRRSFQLQPRSTNNNNNNNNNQISNNSTFTLNPNLGSPPLNSSNTSPKQPSSASYSDSSLYSTNYNSPTESNSPYLSPTFTSNSNPTASSSLSYIPSPSTSSQLKVLKTSSSVTTSPRESRPFSTSSGLTSNSNNNIRKKPPPLSFQQDKNWEEMQSRLQSKVMVRGNSYEGDSDQEEKDRQDDNNNNGNKSNSNKVAEWSNFNGVEDNREVKEVIHSNNSSPGKTREEERDTLSSLYPFISPQLTTINTIPNNNINRMSPSTFRDTSKDSFNTSNNVRDDDTNTSGYSFASTSSEGLENNNQNFASTSSYVYSPDSSSNSTSFSAYRAPYPGVGLGLPFSMSAMDLSSSQNQQSSQKQQQQYRQERSPGTLSLEPESPVTDRSKLIGLGELATPRWTSGVLERRWGGGPENNNSNNQVQVSNDVEFDVLGSYTEGPPQRTMYYADTSPTTTRPFTAQKPSQHSNSSTLPYRSSSPTGKTANLFLPSLQSSDSINLSATGGLIDFSSPNSFQPSITTHPITNSLSTITSRPISPAYSLEALSLNDHESESQETPRKYQDAPTRRLDQSSRKSVGSASSAPTSAVGSSWTKSPVSSSSGGGVRDIVGLGLDYEANNNNTAGVNLSSENIPYGRRDSNTSATSAPSSRRSSLAKAIPSDGKGHTRRSSASRSGFAHLPPSPANTSTTLPFTVSPSIPLTPLPLPTSPLLSTPTLHSQISTTPSSKPLENRRLSHHSQASHHSSPSMIAASILRQTRDFDLEGIKLDLDIDSLAANDNGTAEAMRRLDGLSSTSPRTKSSSNSLQSNSKPRTPTITPPASISKASREYDESKNRRRTRSSTGGSSIGAGQEAEFYNRNDDSFEKSPPLPSSSNESPRFPNPSPTLSSSNFQTRQPTPTLAVPIPRSPLSFQHSQLPRHTTTPGYEIPFPTSTTASPSKRASSSSASINAGNSTSASANSRDSTSGTSFSGASSVATGTTPSLTFKHRRGSASSDVSSTQSSVDLLTTSTRLDRSDSRNDPEPNQFIPPVPPIPKDWESYRPTTGGTTSSSNQNSPRFENQKLFETNYNPIQDIGPTAPLMEPTLSSSSTSKTPTRKWSLSFGKSKSPKPPVVKESTSYADLSKKEKGKAFTQLADSRRMAASSNDIVGLANNRDSEIISNSKLRHSLRGDFSRSSNNNNNNNTIIPIPPRNRTSSMSSSNTSKSNNNNQALPNPTVITTSPGRSRSSLLSPRRTPSSGIPFFSRKSSIASSVEMSTPPPPKVVTEPEEKSSGRRSILGLNFLRSNSSKKEKEVPVIKAPVTRQTISTATATATSKEVKNLDEFGRRASLVPKTSSLITRKRGKTMPGSGVEQEPTSKASGLPPMQMSALAPTTARRVDTLTTSASNSSIFGSSRLQAPTKISKLQESAKGNLSIISASPSVQSFPSTTSDQLSNSTNSSRNVSPSHHGPKPSTPTKIPRPFGRSNLVVSPRSDSKTLASDDSEAPPVPSAASKPLRRLSSIGTKRLSGSVSSSSYPSENDSFPTTTSNNNTDFGLTREPGLANGERTLSTRRRLESESSGIPRSRSNAGSALSTSKTFRELADATSPSTSRAGTTIPRTSRRTSLLPGEERVSTTPRTSTIQPVQNRTLSDSTSTNNNSIGHRRTSSKPIEEIKSTPSVIRRVSTAVSSDPILATSARSSRTVINKVTTSSRVSSSSPSLAPLPFESRRSSAGPINDEVRADEEMSAYVRRQHTKKLAAGMSTEMIQKMFEFPDPTTPLPVLNYRDASALYSRLLTDYEKDEIKEYEQIYFVGPKCDKKPASASVPANNFGFDDERGDYLLVPHDHILYRYEVIDVLGKGSFGQVLQCRDHKTGEMVAIKIIRNKKRFHHQALVEIKVLENLVKWDPEEKHFVIRMVDSFTFRGHLCIVTELLSINLYELVKANSFAGFSTTLIRRFTVQILGSLSLLRHHRVVHCDLKPENILLKHPAKSAIKVIDFGSSCFEHEKVYTYIQSRFYRSPEVILGMNYHMAIDMWSLGCIIAEMYTGYPIFPGENEQEQLACIMEVMGLPEKYLVERSSRKRLFFDSTGAPRPVVNSKGRRRRPNTKTLAQVLKSEDEFFIDFITKCLAWDPEKRLRPDSAMRHPWICSIRQHSKEIPSSGSNSYQSSRSVIGSISTNSSAATGSNTHTGSSTTTSSTISSSQISTPRRLTSTSTSSTTANTSSNNNNNSTSTSIPSNATPMRVRTQSNSNSGLINGITGTGVSSSSSRLPTINGGSVGMTSSSSSNRLFVRGSQ